MSRTLAGSFILALTLATAAPAAFGQSNPYCISGANWATNGVMQRLSMPSDSLGYIWDSLQTTNLVNMVRPCKYWLQVGSTHQAHGYHEDTDTIDNPTTFGAWVAARPGKVWIIGNEPNGSGQDGLSPEQYARMFHTYYTFIHNIDPTARFAIAGLGGNVDSAATVQAHISWFNTALASYRSQFAAAMPIDIWNCHPYTTVGRLNPAFVLNEYIIPFSDYYRAVENGAYSTAELWLTEFGVAVWSTSLDMKYSAQFIQQMCPRLEQSGRVHRFFWFYGPWAGGWDLNMADCSMIGADNLPTILGTTYKNLAMTTPNPLPPPATSQMPYPKPPLAVFTDFASTQLPWETESGTWSLDAGGLRQTRLYGSCGLATFLPYNYRDVDLRYDVKINATTNNDATNWAGVTIRGGSIWDAGDQIATWTYLLFLRRNGELGLWTKQDGTVRAVTQAVADTSVYHRIRVRVVGRHFVVYVDGTQVIDWTDGNNRRPDGIVALRCCKADAHFDNIVVTEVRACDADGDGDVDQSDFASMQACLTGAAVAIADPSCRYWDIDGDNDVDGDDLTRFAGCISGPMLDADRDCLDTH
jgi:hypothetical protein